MQHGQQLESVHDTATGTYDFDPWFEHIAPIIRKADLAVANLELTLAGPPYAGYPQFCAPDELALALKDAGFNTIITANNHSNDRGMKGLVRTLDVLDRYNIPHTGTFRDSAERAEKYPLMLEKEGVKIALLNYTYGTNHIPTIPPRIVNYIDTARIAADLAKATEMNADVNLVTIHWGVEYERMPNAEQKRVEAFCYRHGADMVIGSHPHVLQPVERKRIGSKKSSQEVLTAWCMGNFVSNQRTRYRDGGMILWVELTKGAGGTTISKAGYIPTWVWTDESSGRKIFRVVPLRGTDSLEHHYDWDTVSEEGAITFWSDTKEHLGKHNRNVPMMDYQALPDSLYQGPMVYSILLYEDATNEDIESIVMPWRTNHWVRENANGSRDVLYGKFYDPLVGEAFFRQIRKNYPGAKLISYPRP